MPRLALALLPACLVACGAHSELIVQPAHPGCGPLTATPVQLASVGAPRDFLQPTQLAVANGVVYYEVSDQSNNPHAIYGVPITGGTPTQLVMGVPGCASSPFSQRALVTDGAHLYTPDEEARGCSGYSVRVTAVDLATGAVSMLPDPPDLAEPRLVTLTQDAGALLGLVTDGNNLNDTRVIRWDGASPRVLARLTDFAGDLVAAGDHAFVLSRSTLYDVALDGSGTVTALDTVDPMHFAFFGATPSAVVYTRDGTTIVRRDLAAHAPTTLVTDADASRAASAEPGWVDDTWVYFKQGAGVTDAHALARVPIMGGPVEVLWRGAQRSVIAVTSDACGVYWLAQRAFSPDELPPAVFARRR